MINVELPQLHEPFEVREAHVADPCLTEIQPCEPRKPGELHHSGVTDLGSAEIQGLEWRSPFKRTNPASADPAYCRVKARAAL